MMLAHPSVLLPLLLSGSPLRHGVRLCADDDQPIVVPDVDLGEASERGASALEELRLARMKHLESLGASEAPPPPPSPPERSTFSVSNGQSESARAAADEALRKLRQQDAGELEAPHAEEIARARRIAQQWLDAGLFARAEAELVKVERYVSHKSSLGADFHLELARVTELSGNALRARKTRQRVAREAESSSARWRADQLLQQSARKGSSGASSSSTSGSANPELSSLFKMPTDWNKT